MRALREGLLAEAEAGLDFIPAPLPEPGRTVPSGANAETAGGDGPRVLSREERVRRLAALDRQIAGCTACGLHAGRTLTVPGEGDPEAPVMFVGEGPGEQEDLSGRPFVGRAGQVLRRLIREQLGKDPAEVFIANVVKCRPPGNRAPQPDEAAACLPFLRKQVSIVRPRILVTLGNPATQALLKTTEGISRLRGRPVRLGDFVVFPTFHPSYLLRNPSALPVSEEDFRAVRRLLEGGVQRGPASPLSLEIPSGGG